jgi:hypothetical protein
MINHPKFKQTCTIVPKLISTTGTLRTHVASKYLIYIITGAIFEALCNLM